MAEASEAMLGFATTNGGSADLEIVVYCPVWALVRSAATHNSTLAGVIGAWAGTAVVTRPVMRTP